MKSILVFGVVILAVVTLGNAVPLIDSKEDTVQPFSLSPGNVNPDEFFAKVYGNGGKK